VGMGQSEAISENGRSVSGIGRGIKKSPCGDKSAGDKSPA